MIGELAAVLSNTEIIVLKFHQSSGLSQRLGQALSDMLKHLELDIKYMQNTNCSGDLSGPLRNVL